MVPLLPKLRGQFAEFLNNIYLAHLKILFPPTCVGLRYEYLYAPIWLFLSLNLTTSLLFFTPPCGTNFSICSLSLFQCVPIYSIHFGSAGIFYLLPIDYAFRPRLRSRLTQGRSALPWKPWIFGQEDSHLFLATHSGILSS